MGHIHRVEVGHSQQKASIIQSVICACSRFNLSDYNADLTLKKKKEDIKAYTSTIYILVTTKH